MATENPTYQELARIRAASENNLAFQTIQTGVLTNLNGVMGSIHSEMAEVRQLHAEGLAAQQELLQREALQDRIEEFLYQAEKLVEKCSSRDTDIPYSSRYFLLQGIVHSVHNEGISTAIIKGRENKKAFDDVVAKINKMLSKLSEIAEVKEAIEWAEAENRRAIAERNRANRERGRQQLLLQKYNSKVFELQQEKLPALNFGIWYSNRLRNFREIPVLGLLFVFPPTSLMLQVIAWAMYGFFWIPIAYALSAAYDKNKIEKHNKAIDEKIERLNETARKHGLDPDGIVLDFEEHEPPLGIAYDGEVHS
tara:strand:- start:9015 stop:9941 length:927 start_codon:yes stop_codon:yes gene_type:complete